MTPLPFVTRSTTRSFAGFASSRSGPTVPLASGGREDVAAAAACLGEDRLAVCRLASFALSAGPRPRLRTTRLRAHRQRRDRRDVQSHGVGVLARDDVSGHPGGAGGRFFHRIRDLVADDGLDRVDAETVRARLAESVVEVRPDHTARARIRQNVALGALLLEELLAAGRVARLGQTGRAAAGRGQRRDQGRAGTGQPTQLHSRRQIPCRGRLRASGGSRRHGRGP